MTIARRLLAAPLLVVPLLAARAEAPPAGLPAPVTSLSIAANGLRGEDVSGEETAADCARFRLRRRDVAEFLARARPVDARAYHHDLEMSRCHARGTLRLADGRRGRWRIDRERRGAILLDGAGPVYLHCPGCAARGFEPVYDPDRDG